MLAKNLSVNAKLWYHTDPFRSLKDEEKHFPSENVMTLMPLCAQSGEGQMSCVRSLNNEIFSCQTLLRWNKEEIVITSAQNQSLGSFLIFVIK